MARNSFIKQSSCSSRAAVLTILEISGPLTWNLSLGLIHDKCWANIKYTSCEFSGTSVVLTLGEAYDNENTIEMYLDNSVNNGSAGTATTGYKVDSRWGNSFLTIDSNTFTTEQKPVTLDLLIPTLTPDENSALDIIPKNAGDKATYIFKFKEVMLILYSTNSLFIQNETLR